LQFLPRDSTQTDLEATLDEHCRAIGATALRHLRDITGAGALMAY